MIKKLRIKFVCIIMGAVLLVIAAAFAYLLYSTGEQQQTLTENALTQVMLQLVDQEGGPRPHIGKRQTQWFGNEDISVTGAVTFWVMTELDGSVITQNVDQVDIDPDTLSEVAALAAAGSSDSGFLADYNLRFLRQQDGDEYLIVFADRASETRTIQNLAKSLMLVGAGILAVLLGLSIFLAWWTLRPVETAWRQQRQFVADASHELKTPLTVILANTQILLSQPDATVRQQRKWVESTAAEGADMRGLIDDMLFLAKQDAAVKNSLPADPVDLSELILGAALSIEPVAFEKGVRLETDIRPGLTATGDQAQLRRLTMTLLENACKYAGGDKLVRVALTEEKGFACFAVSNPGPSIPGESLPHLFERFYRVDKSRARSEGGYGLGLSIAQSIVRAHHGSIAVASENDLTTFTVRLPLAAR